MDANVLFGIVFLSLKKRATERASHKKEGKPSLGESRKRLNGDVSFSLTFNVTRRVHVHCSLLRSCLLSLDHLKIYRPLRLLRGWLLTGLKMCTFFQNRNSWSVYCRPSFFVMCMNYLHIWTLPCAGVIIISLIAMYAYLLAGDRLQLCELQLSHSAHRNYPVCDKPPC